jgi:hypothetical protein
MDPRADRRRRILAAGVIGTFMLLLILVATAGPSSTTEVVHDAEGGDTVVITKVKKKFSGGRGTVLKKEKLPVLASGTADANVPAVGGDDAPEASPADAAPTGKKKNVAVTVLVTTSKKSPDLGPTIDSLGVLRLSVLAVASPATAERAWHAFEFVAMVTPEVPKEWLAVIRRMGYVIKVIPSPLEPSDIRNKQIAKEVVTDGAMGITEMVKLDVWRWTEYHRVLLVDCDILFHKNFDELFEHGASLGWTHGGWVAERINGGFLVVNPHQDGATHYDAILALLREGDFRPGTGWKGSGIGWTYGGRTIQGLLPYYFLKVLPNTTANNVELERCRYNNMVQLDKCKPPQYSVAQVTSNHFTGNCVKPWWCSPVGPMCSDFVQRWWGLRQRLARELKVMNVKNAFGAAGSCQQMAGRSYNSISATLIAGGA